MQKHVTTKLELTRDEFFKLITLAIPGLGPHQNMVKFEVLDGGNPPEYRAMENDKFRLSFESSVVVGILSQGPGGGGQASMKGEG